MRILFISIIFFTFLFFDNSFAQVNKRNYTVNCEGTTKRGTACKLRTSCNNNLCYHHGGNCYSNSNNNSKTNNSLKLPIQTISGMKYISVKIGGVYYDFLIDTGASTMTVDSKLEDKLLNSRKISRRNYKPKAYYIADGTKIILNETVISSIVIGGKLFKNVKVAIGDSNTSRLLGMSFLNQFNWKIRGNYLELQ
tara:strand:+ start:1134 stop:1718 length:585 start_codon:yes stop_codon:yes gene_type:complete